MTKGTVGAGLCGLVVLLYVAGYVGLRQRDVLILIRLHKLPGLELPADLPCVILPDLQDDDPASHAIWVSSGSSQKTLQYGVMIQGAFAPLCVLEVAARDTWSDFRHSAFAID
ncbi:MAG: hypothetical protein ACT4QC_12855 [Planctomycetaceae bacterium]